MMGLLTYHLRLFTIGVSGQDIPDGSKVIVELHDATNAQVSGDPMALEAGTIISVRRSAKDLHVVSTKRRP